MKCPKCGEKLNGSACTYCGLDLTGDEIRLIGSAGDAHMSALAAFIRETKEGAESVPPPPPPDPPPPPSPPDPPQDNNTKKKLMAK